MSTVTMAFTVGVFSIFSRETPLLVGDMLVNFGHILPETSKGSACWVRGGKSPLTWLSRDTLYFPQWIDLELKSRFILDIHIYIVYFWCLNVTPIGSFFYRNYS